jgi:anti-anti-sigma regulatory factor
MFSVDLSPRADPSGIAALARVRSSARQAGGDLLLAAPQRQVLRVLAVTRLIGTFSVPDGVAAAAVSTVLRPGTSPKQRFRPAHRPGPGGR